MSTQLSKLLKMLKPWLTKNSLEGDVQYYEIKEWQKRGELYLNDAEFVITTEGGLSLLINYGDSAEFYNLIESFGYYLEMGHSWNFGFYKVEDDPEHKSNLGYKAKLRDERWLNKRKIILDRAKNQCEDCGGCSRLEIHHCYYMFGCEPWEYPFDSLRCLCRSCHEERGFVEKVHRSHLAQLSTEELKIITGIIDCGFLTFKRDELFSFLFALNKCSDQLTERFSKLVNTKRSPTE